MAGSVPGSAPQRTKREGTVSKSAWLIILFGLAALLFLIIAIGPWIGFAATSRALPFAFFFLAAGHFVTVLP